MTAYYRPDNHVLPASNYGLASSSHKVMPGYEKLMKLSGRSKPRLTSRRIGPSQQMSTDSTWDERPASPFEPVAMTRSSLVRRSRRKSGKWRKRIQPDLRKMDHEHKIYVPGYMKDAVVIQDDTPHTDIGRQPLISRFNSGLEGRLLLPPLRSRDKVRDKTEREKPLPTSRRSQYARRTAGTRLASSATRISAGNPGFHHPVDARDFVDYDGRRWIDDRGGPGMERDLLDCRRLIFPQSIGPDVSLQSPAAFSTQEPDPGAGSRITTAPSVYWKKEGGHNFGLLAISQPGQNSSLVLKVPCAAARAVPDIFKNNALVIVAALVIICLLSWELF